MISELYRLRVWLILFLLLPFFGKAQMPGLPDGWGFVLNPASAFYAIPESVLFNGMDELEVDDWIGAFFEDDGELHCAGAVQWTGDGNIAISIFGNDTLPPNPNTKNGFYEGELIQWKFYYQSNSEEVCLKAYDGDGEEFYWFYGDPGWVTTPGMETNMSVYVTSALLDGVPVMNGKAAAFDMLTGQCRAVEEFFDGGGMGQCILTVGFNSEEAGNEYYYLVWDSDVDIIYEVVETGVYVSDDFLMLDLTLIPGASPVVLTTFTAADGTYLFEDVPDGTWTVCTGLTEPTEGYFDECAEPIATPPSAVVDFALIIVGPLLVNPFAFPSEICPGESVQLFANVQGGTGQYEYNWVSDIGGFQSSEPNPIVSPEETTVYLIEVNDGNIIAGGVVLVMVNPIPDCPEYGPFCEGDTFVNFSESGTFIYNDVIISGWNPSLAGTFTIFYSGANAFGCTVNCEFDVVVNPLPLVDAGPDIVVEYGESITITGATAYSANPPLSYFWFPEDAFIDNTVLNPTTVNLQLTNTYSLIVTDGNGCTNSDQIMIMITGGPLLVNPFAIPSEICLGEYAQLFANAQGGTGQYEYNWVSDIGGFQSSEPNPIVSPEETTVYLIEVNDGNSITAGVFVIYVQPIVPIADCPDIDSVCEDSDYILFPLVDDGTYYFEGMVVNGFDPSFAGIYDFSLVVVNEFGCVDVCDFSIEVFTLPEVICPADFNLCIDHNPISLTGANPVGGIYSGSGVSGGVFSPSVAGVGVHEILYFYLDVNGCSNECTFFITVTDELPLVTCPQDFSLCIDDDPISLTGANPVGGFYSGIGVSGGVFSPSVAGVGVHEITYTYTDTSGCSNNCTYFVTVNELPLVTCPQDFSLCIDDDPISLTGANPVGGFYSGSGVSGGVFSPSVAGVGVHEITYTYTDTNGCSNNCTYFITVNELPLVTCPQDFSLCIDDDPVSLTGANPLGGIYSGSGVSGGVFSPSAAGVGVHEITYTYTDGNGCENDCLFFITVNDLPVVSCPDNLTLCMGFGILPLAGATPEGGIYSGQGVINGIFFKSIAGVGVHEIFYTYTDASGCVNDCSFNITVNALPDVSCPQNFSLCIDADPFTLTGATPAGGVYSGAGVSGGIFNPSVAGVGTHEITYTYTDANGCANDCTFNITVNPLPVVTCPDDFAICVDNGPLTLTGATPTGGTYSGNGVSGGIFNPSVAGVGTHEITYTYTDANGCANDCTFNITVNPSPVVTCPDDFAICVDSGPLTLTGATPTGGTYSGNGVSGGIFNPSVAGVGTHEINYTYTDANGCTNDCTFTITVIPLPVVTCPDDFAICVDNGPLTLSGATPSGGTYSGNGVSGGIFTPTAPGVFIIYYDYTDPNTGCSGQCEFEIEVVPLPIVDAGSDATIHKNDTHQLDAFATNYSSLFWTTSGDGSFSAPDILDPVYTPGVMDIENATVVLSITAFPLSPCELAIDTMILTIDTTTGIISYNKKAMVNVFPNPASTEIQIECFALLGDFLIIEIMNSGGFVVADYFIHSLNRNDQNYTLNTASFTSGLYFVRLRNDQFDQLKKIVIKN
jgi:hypothetical protein